MSRANFHLTLHNFLLVTLFLSLTSLFFALRLTFSDDDVTNAMEQRKQDAFLVSVALKGNSQVNSDA